MKFVLQPSLEHMALVKIVTSLWSQDDVRDLLLKVKARLDQDLFYTDQKWKKIEEKVIEKVVQLSLPQLLKEKLVCFTMPIGVEVYNWMCFHWRDLCVDLPAKLCWTPQGTVNGKKTAEVLVQDDNLDMPSRYIVACVHCLEDDVHRLWNTMPEDLKEHFLNHEEELVAIWSGGMKLRGRRGIIQNTYESALRYCVIFGFKTAAEYFLQKLTPREREVFLLKMAKELYEENFDMLFFLISIMNEEQQIEILTYAPFRVLDSFLNWPLQSFFIGVANCMWDCMSLLKEFFNDVLRVIVERVTDGFKDFNYQILFREFWQRSPDALKKIMTDDIDEDHVLFLLFRIKDKENITLILENATLTVKENLIYSARMNKFCQHSIRDNEWDFLEFCIRECLPSKNAMLKFKGEFEKRRMSPYFKRHFKAKKHKWNRLFRSSDDSVCKYGKRSAEEGESSSSKRFHSLQ